MADIVNTGTAPNDGNGDPLRHAFAQINERLQQLLGTVSSRGAWTAATAYTATPLREWVINPATGLAYLAASNHTSGATFAADLAAGKWFAVDVAQIRADLLAADGGDLINKTAMTTVQRTVTGSSNGTGSTIYAASANPSGHDTFFADHTSTGASGSGYGFHALDYGDGAAGGGAIGGATERTTMADAIVGNRRGTGPGNGLYGTRWEAGDGSGVRGVRRGTGAGHGVFAHKVETGVGSAMLALNESTDGHGVSALRRNGGGAGDGVRGYAASAGVGEAYTYTPITGIKYESASVRGVKLAGDNGHAVLADGQGNHAALLAVARGNAHPAAELLTTSTNTSLFSGQVLRENGTIGIGLEAKVAGAAGARTGAVIAGRSIVQPTGASTGAGIVTAHDAAITSSVTGSADSRAVSGTNSATGGSSAAGILGLSDGANTINYGVYGNAANGTTNWSGYFVGNVYIGGTLTNPSDERLKDLHHQLDGAQALANVMAAHTWVYDKYAVWKDEATGEQRREKVAINEVGPIAQELQGITPSHVTQAGDYLAVIDRSELYQLKAAVAHLARVVADAGLLPRVG